jgi:hypothetical protein
VLPDDAVVCPHVHVDRENSIPSVYASNISERDSQRKDDNY